MSDGTPRGLSEKDAAAYCGVSPDSLRLHGPKPLRIGTRKVYDRKILDAWLDRLSNVTAPSAEDQWMEAAHGQDRHAVR
jgi:hypothetical protein